jgi:hypothetical protein
MKMTVFTLMDEQVLRLKIDIMHSGRLLQENNQRRHMMKYPKVRTYSFIWWSVQYVSSAVNFLSLEEKCMDPLTICDSLLLCY